jgi:hypothetical protein
VALEDFVVFVGVGRAALRERLDEAPAAAGASVELCLPASSPHDHDACEADTEQRD